MSRFVKSVLSWLRLFPGSPITSARQEQLIDNVTLISLFHMLLDPDFKETKHMRDTLDALWNYKDSLWFDKLYQYLNLLNVEKLLELDNHQLSFLSYILFEIGINSFNSSMAVSIVNQMLNKKDQGLLLSLINDQNDLYGENLLLNQRILIMEQENAEIKRDNKICLNKLKCLVKEIDGLKKDIDSLTSTLELKDTELFENKSHKDRLLKLNRSLQDQLEVMNNDVKFFLKQEKTLTICEVDSLEYHKWKTILLTQILKYSI